MVGGIIYWIIVFTAVGGIAAIARRRGGTGWLWGLLAVLAYLVGEVLGTISIPPYDIMWLAPFGAWLGLFVVFMAEYVLLGFGRSTGSTWQCPECRMYQEPATLVCDCGGKAPKDMVRVSTGLLLRSVLAIGIVMGLFWLANSSLAHGFYQRQTYKRMESVRTALEEFNTRFTGYPKSLNAVYPLITQFSTIAGGPTDGWGRPVLYRQGGTGYLLLSLGRDLRPDQEDYSYLWEQDPPVPPLDVCGNLGADLIATEKGWHSVCRDGG